MKEMLLTWLAVTVVLLVIMIGNVLARSLARVTDGGVSAETVLILVGVKSISLLVTLIPLGMYLGILLAHGRFYRDNEMTVMQACGVSWLDLLRPTAVVGLLGVLLISALTIFASPWAARYEQTLKTQIDEQSALSLLTPGRFVESSDGRAILFVKEASADKTQLNDVFMYRQREGARPAVDSARFATYQKNAETGDEFLVLSEGQSSIGRPGEADFTVTDFKRQGVLRPRELQTEPRLRGEAMSLTQLWQSGENKDMAEIQWRISIPIAALLLALLAVPLSYTSPREGRFSKIAIAILLYIPYANLLVLSRKWIASGVLPSWVGLWPIHLLMLALIVYFLVRRQGLAWITGGYKQAVPTQVSL